MGVPRDGVEAGVTDGAGHGSYDTTCSTKDSGLARSPLSFEHGFWTLRHRRVAGGVSGVQNRSVLGIVSRTSNYFQSVSLNLNLYSITNDLMKVIVFTEQRLAIRITINAHPAREVTYPIFDGQKQQTLLIWG